MKEPNPQTEIHYDRDGYVWVITNHINGETLNGVHIFMLVDEFTDGTLTDDVEYDKTMVFATMQEAAAHVRSLGVDFSGY